MITEDAVLAISRAQRTPRRRHADAAAYPAIVIPADAPAFARTWLIELDTQIAGRALLRLGEITDHSRLAEAGWQLSHATGETAFFLFHYIRLLFGQAEARSVHAPLPPQTWTVADWAPGVAA